MIPVFEYETEHVSIKLRNRLIVELGQVFIRCFSVFEIQGVNYFGCFDGITQFLALLLTFLEAKIVLCKNFNASKEFLFCLQ